jgi:hypothetical protein
VSVTAKTRRISKTLVCALSTSEEQAKHKRSTSEAQAKHKRSTSEAQAKHKRSTSEAQAKHKRRHEYKQVNSDFKNKNIEQNV